jgi:heme/copper-type cytochrome/quinol oxidase subunit 4
MFIIMDSFYIINVPNKEYIELINDICRMIIIQITVQFLFFINSPSEVEFFAAEFILLVIYIVLAVCLYWLIFRKLVTFK